MSSATSVPDVGSVAPDFTLKGASGVEVALSAKKSKRRTLLVFYPQDMTSGCTDQLSALRDTLAEFHALDTDPYGVNEGDAASHQQFIDELDLPFDLLVDEGLKVSTAYAALKPEGNRILRTVVVIGKDGKIIFRAQGAPSPEELLSAISTAKDAPAG
jgi:thioredoxin-dependent peroxiredoxin